MRRQVAATAKAAFTIGVLSLPIPDRLLSAQGTLGLKPNCARCQIEVSTRVRFQELWRDGGLPHRPYSVSRFARDEWLVVDASANLVYRFDRDGQYKGPVARQGAGPGEFKQPTLALAWPGDSTTVFDSQNRRMTIYDPSGRESRNQRWDGAAVLRATVTDDGGLLMSSRIGTRSSFGMPLHRFKANGELVQSFGSKRDAEVVRPSDVPVLRLPSHTRPDGAFWSIHATAPTLQQWNRAGVVTETWDLPIPDFVAARAFGLPGAGGEEFFLIEEVAPGRLLLGLVYRESRFKGAYGRSKTVDGRTVTTVENFGLYFDTRLMVLDTRTRSLLAVKDVDEYLVGNLGAGRFWGISPGGESGQLVVVDVAFRTTP